MKDRVGHYTPTHNTSASIASATLCLKGTISSAFAFSQPGRLPPRGHRFPSIVSGLPQLIESREDYLKVMFVLLPKPFQQSIIQVMNRSRSQEEM
jgi:hypothetical protein